MEIRSADECRGRGARLRRQHEGGGDRLVVNIVTVPGLAAPQMAQVDIPKSLLDRVIWIARLAGLRRLHQLFPSPSWQKGHMMFSLTQHLVQVAVPLCTLVRIRPDLLCPIPRSFLITLKAATDSLSPVFLIVVTIAPSPSERFDAPTVNSLGWFIGATADLSRISNLFL